MNEKKVSKLLQQMNDYAQRNIVVAFSGGVDSSLILKMACEAAKKNGTTVYAVTMQTKLHPMPEMDHAKKMAEEIGAEHMVLPVNELVEADIEENPVDRCYRCKKHLFWKIQQKAAEMGISDILEGTNEDDLHVYRPGLRALKELGIKSPLAEAGITKHEVRQLAKQYGLSVSNRPSMPCLATRFPYGTRLFYEDLKKVEQGEEYLRSLGLYNLRLRVHGDTARIEVDVTDFSVILDKREEVIDTIKGLGYSYVTLDLEGFRSGSMDVGM